MEKRNKKLKGYQGFVNKLGYKELEGLDPDEIKLKIDQIMNWNDNETDKNNSNSYYFNSTCLYEIPLCFGYKL